MKAQRGETDWKGDRGQESIKGGRTELCSRHVYRRVSLRPGCRGTCRSRHALRGDAGAGAGAGAARHTGLGALGGLDPSCDRSGVLGAVCSGLQGVRTQTGARGRGGWSRELERCTTAFLDEEPLRLKVEAERPI